MKEFNDTNRDGQLSFEGEYLNGKKSGLGKEYGYDLSLRFEDEYLNGLWNGKGKQYDYDGKLIFEGDFVNGNRVQ